MPWFGSYSNKLLKYIMLLDVLHQPHSEAEAL